MKTRLIAVQDVEGARFVAEGTEGHSCARAWIESLGIVLIHFELKRGFFNGPETDEAKAADGHVLDQSALDLVLRIEVALKGGEKLLKYIDAFLFQDDGAGEQAMAQAVRGGTGLGCGGIGSAGLGAIGARGVDSTF